MPKKAHYRKFGIKDARPARTTSPRWRRWSRAGSRGSPTGRARRYDESFAAAPNLVVIDGGKGQLAAALAAMQAYDLPRVAVIALAKRSEEVFVPGQTRPIVLSRHDAGPPAPAADPRRGAPLRGRLPPAAPRVARLRVALRRARGGRARRGGARSSTTSARSTRWSRRRPRSSRAFPASRRRSRGAIYAQLHKTGRG